MSNEIYDTLTILKTLDNYFRAYGNVVGEICEPTENEDVKVIIHIVDSMHDVTPGKDPKFAQLLLQNITNDFNVRDLAAKHIGMAFSLRSVVKLVALSLEEIHKLKEENRELREML